MARMRLFRHFPGWVVPSHGRGFDPSICLVDHGLLNAASKKLRDWRRPLELEKAGGLAAPCGLAAFSTKWGRCHFEEMTDGVRPAATTLEVQARLISAITRASPPTTTPSGKRRQDTPALPFEPSLALSVVHRSLFSRVGSAVNLDNELHGMRSEIGSIWADRHLPAELHAEFVVSQLPPDHRLGLCHRAAIGTSEFSR